MEHIKFYHPDLHFNKKVIPSQLSKFQNSKSHVNNIAYTISCLFKITTYKIKTGETGRKEQKSIAIILAEIF